MLCLGRGLFAACRCWVDAILSDPVTITPHFHDRVGGALKVVSGQIDGVNPAEECSQYLEILHEYSVLAIPLPL